MNYIFDEEMIVDYDSEMPIILCIDDSKNAKEYKDIYLEIINKLLSTLKKFYNPTPFINIVSLGKEPKTLFKYFKSPDIISADEIKLDFEQEEANISKGMSLANELMSEQMSSIKERFLEYTRPLILLLDSGHLTGDEKDLESINQIIKESKMSNNQYRKHYIYFELFINKDESVSSKIETFARANYIQNKDKIIPSLVEFITELHG
ncbi:MAG: hypothetical protein K5925_00840 [Bacilli bacterium]|nr:hypothetical protein [Bacilli bacterium]